MDETVIRAIAKWPDVPAAYGWLALDRRGAWWVKGERITSAAITAFIGRNYHCDPAGCWFFQNGPQRVFVDLGYVPYVLRTEPVPAGLALVTHTGQAAAAPSSALLDENGSVLVAFDASVGLVHDQDLPGLLPSLTDPRGATLSDAALEQLAALAQAGEAWLALAGTRLPLRPIGSAEVAGRFGFVPHPRPAEGEQEC
jgi:hypothetical protein